MAGRVALPASALDVLERRPVNLSQRINLCRTRHQSSAALAPESAALLSLEAFVAREYCLNSSAFCSVVHGNGFRTHFCCLPERRVLYKHVFRNALIPTVAAGATLTSFALFLNFSWSAWDTRCERSRRSLPFR